ncbi:uncharacterized protein TNCV_4923661 [Trichonephila clavipes]|nr:uncharacterized protein TNCV_4923661 [Trichonephila clavipes]
MGHERKRRQKKRKFHGNFRTAKKKIFDIEILMSIFSILSCPVCYNQELFLIEDSRLGLQSNLCLKCSLRYTSYYGDGDSKAFNNVKDIYGYDIVVKYECIGHMQKRVGSRLQKLKKSTKGLGGKGKLTDKFIDTLQNYFGIAIRSNVGNLSNMQTAVIAAFFHCCSTDKKPMHGQCPSGSDTWCKYQKAKQEGKLYKHRTAGLPNAVLNTVKTTYMDLCDQSLLEKCLHGKTQNANESFNGVLWSIIPKETFVELLTLQFGAFLAVLQFNDGSKGILSVLEYLHIPMGYFILKGFSKVDDERIVVSERHSLPTTKNKRKKLRGLKKRNCALSEKKEGVTYKSGEF